MERVNFHPSIELSEEESESFDYLRNLATNIEQRSGQKPGSLHLLAVGGWVRDKLMSRQSKDIDLVASQWAFDLLENKLLEITPVKRMEEIAQGMDVLRFDMGSIEFDVRGLETDSIDDDIKTRDFSINSVYYDLRRFCIVDPKSFAIDINNRIIRGCQDLKAVFHDKNRYARYCRLMHSMELTPADDLKSYVAENCHKRWQQQCQKRELRRLSVELKKSFLSDKMEAILNEMADIGVLSCFTSDIAKTKRLITYLVRLKNVLESSDWKLVCDLYQVRRLIDKAGDPRGTWYMLRMAVVFYFYRIKLHFKQPDPFVLSISCFFDDDKNGNIQQELSLLYKITDQKNHKEQKTAFYAYVKNLENKKPYLAVLMAAYNKDKKESVDLLGSVLDGLVDRDKLKESSGSSYMDSKIKYLREDEGFPL